MKYKNKALKCSKEFLDSHPPPPRLKKIDMNKEEILRKIIINSYEEEVEVPPSWSVFQDIRLFQVVNAMGEYAKQEAIAFAKWVNLEKFHYSNISNKWLGWRNTKFSHTTEELYSLYLQSKEK